MHLIIAFKVNKFKGIFGQQIMEFPNESLMGQISPDKRLVVIKIPCQEEAIERDGAAGGPAGESNHYWAVLAFVCMRV